MLHSVGLNLAHTRLPTFFHPNGLADGYFSFVFRSVHKVHKAQQVATPTVVAEKSKKLAIQVSTRFVDLLRRRPVADTSSGLW